MPVTYKTPEPCRPPSIPPAPCAFPQLPALQEAGDQLAMHVAGMRPAYLARGAVPEHVLERERHVLTEQLTADPGLAGKPAAVLGKVVEGRLGKVLGEWCLLEQRFVLEDSVTVEQMLKRWERGLRGERGVGSTGHPGLREVEGGHGLADKRCWAGFRGFCWEEMRCG